MDKWRKALTLAMVFPGQGSQSIGMQADLAQEFPEVLEVYAEASEQLGFDLWQAAQDGPQEKLDETEITQPVMLSAGVAAWKAWNKSQGQVMQGLVNRRNAEWDVYSKNIYQRW